MIRIKPDKRAPGRWEVDIRITLPDGTRIRERKQSPVTSKSGTERWARDREAELYQKGKEAKIARAQAPTVAEFRDRFMEWSRAQRNKASTIYQKESILDGHIIPHLGTIRLDEITDAHVQDLKNRLTNLSGKTVNNILGVLSTMLRVAVKPYRVIRHRPVDIEPVRKKPSPFQFYDFESYSKLIDGARSVGQEALAVVLLGGDAGLRQGEILALEQKHVDWDQNRLGVHLTTWRQVTDAPKGGVSRWVPMTARLRDALQACRHMRGPLFFYYSKRRGRGKGQPSPFWFKTVAELIRQSQAAAGLPVTGRCHDLRHTFCSHLAMRGVPLPVIKDLAGHSDIKTTLRYAHLTKGAKEQAIQLLERGP